MSLGAFDRHSGPAALGDTPDGRREVAFAKAERPAHLEALAAEAVENLAPALVARGASRTDTVRVARCKSRGRKEASHAVNAIPPRYCRGSAGRSASHWSPPTSLVQLYGASARRRSLFQHQNTQPSTSACAQVASSGSNGVTCRVDGGTPLELLRHPLIEGRLHELGQPQRESGGWRERSRRSAREDQTGTSRNAEGRVKASQPGRGNGGASGQLCAAPLPGRGGQREARRVATLPWSRLEGSIAACARRP